MHWLALVWGSVGHYVCDLVWMSSGCSCMAGRNKCDGLAFALLTDTCGAPPLVCRCEYYEVLAAKKY